MSELARTVSVVIPTYNAPTLLLDTLGTVFAQTFDDYEVIVINDGSTDDTVQQLQPLQQKHGAKLRVVTQPNGGIGAARNRGLDESTGTYIALLDHDDWWKPTKLAEQVRYLQTHPQCVACGTLFSLSSTPDQPHFTREQVCDADGIVHRPFYETVQNRDVFQTSTLMIDRVRTAGLRYGTERGAIEDVQFHIRLLTRGLYGIAGNEILAVYRLFEANASKQADFYYRGVSLLRRLERSNTFKGLPPQQRLDMQLWLGHLGRVAAMKELQHLRRRRAVRLYLRELWPQVKQRRWRFLAAYPLLLLSRGLGRKRNGRTRK